MIITDHLTFMWNTSSSSKEPFQSDNNNNIEELETLLYINATFSSIIAFFAIFGNFFIIFIFIKSKEIRNINNIAITFLSIGDFLRGSIVMTIKIYDQYNLKTNLPISLCKVTAVICGFTFVFSPLILALIAFIRYGKIVGSNGKYTRLTNKKVYIAIGCAFILAIVFAFLPVFGIGLYDYSIPHGVCFASWSKENRVFRTIFYLIVVGAAFPILSVCYLKLYLELRCHQRNLSKTRSSSTNSSQVYNTLNKCRWCRKSNKTARYLKPPDMESSISHGHVILDHYNNYENTTNIAVIAAEEEISRHKSLQNQCNCQKRKSRANTSISNYEYQVTIAVILIFIAYCICWLPAAVINVIALVDTQLISVQCKIIIITLIDLKSCLDPLIYGLGNRQYRKAFLDLLIKKKKLHAIRKQ